MSTIGSLFVNLMARTASFDSKMKRSRKNVSGLGKGLGSLKGFAMKAGAALGVYLGARAMKTFVGGAMESVDATAKLSDKLGIATEDIQRLRHAAEITGAGTATMDKSLENMTRRLGEASQGTGEAVQGLDMLGLSADRMMKMSPAKAFSEIADGIKGLSTPAEKAAAAYKIFGRQGITLLNTLNLGSEGLAEMGEEADKMGVSFSRLDAAKVEAANDAMFKVKQVITGIGQTLAIELSPYIEAAANYFVGLATSGEGMSNRVIGAVEWVTKGIAKMADLIFIGKTAWQGLSVAATGALYGVVWAVEKAAEGIVKLLNLIPGVELEVPAMLTGLKTALHEQLEGELLKMEEMLGEKLPSEKVDEFFNAIKGGALEAANAVAVQNQQMIDTVGLLEDMEAKGSKGLPSMIAGRGIGSYVSAVGMSMATGSGGNNNNRDDRRDGLLKELVTAVKNNQTKIGGLSSGGSI